MKSYQKCFVCLLMSGWKGPLKDYGFENHLLTIGILDFQPLNVPLMNTSFPPPSHLKTVGSVVCDGASSAVSPDDSGLPTTSINTHGLSGVSWIREFRS